jgi:hypothetical protein
MSTYYMPTDIHRAQLESSLIKLANADTQIEDLKIQLDNALGAEEMVFQLTERNLMLGEVNTVVRARSSCSHALVHRKLRKCGLPLKTLKPSRSSPRSWRRIISRQRRRCRMRSVRVLLFVGSDVTDAIALV